MSHTILHRRLTGASAVRFARRASAVLAIGLVALAAPAAAGAQDQPPSTATGGAQAPQPVPPAPRSGVVKVAGAVAVAARADTLLGSVARFRGSVRPRDARRTVVIQRYDEATGRWVAVARTTVGRHGGFVAHWRPDQSGRLRVRALLRPRQATSTRVRSRARALTASPALAVNVYRPALATWYGPGFFGNRTACGITLEPDTLGVAHRTLPCGTKVALFAGGRTLTVEVIDRGPYGGNGASWDLTQATAEALGMTASQTIGALPLTGDATSARR